MKAAEFATILDAYGAALAAAGAASAARTVAGLASAFTGTATVAALVKKAAPSAAPLHPPVLRDAAAALEPLRALLAVAGRTAAVNDLEAVAAVLAAYPAAGIELFAPAKPAKVARTPRARASAGLRDDLVAAHAARFRAALGDEVRFSEALAAAGADALSVGEWKALARAVAGGAAASKAAALKRIDQAHQQQLSFSARAAATGGRSAA